MYKLYSLILCYRTHKNNYVQWHASELSETSTPQSGSQRLEPDGCWPPSAMTLQSYRALVTILLSCSGFVILKSLVGSLLCVSVWNVDLTTISAETFLSFAVGVPSRRSYVVRWTILPAVSEPAAVIQPLFFSCCACCPFRRSWMLVDWCVCPLVSSRASFSLLNLVVWKR